MELTKTLKRNIKKAIQRWFFYNENLQSLVWAMYYKPNKNCPSVKISSSAEKHLNELRENGITLISGFESVADYVENTYFSVIEGRQSFSDQELERIELGPREDATNSMTYRISYKDQGLAQLLFNPDICGILYNYYQRQPYYRQQPQLIYNAMRKESPIENLYTREVSSKFHVDAYRQIALVLLVKDLTINDTHLQYAIGSHKTRHPWDRYKVDDEKVSSQYKIFDAVGPKGTLIIMDNGSGLHRGVHKPGTIRKSLHTDITPGHYFLFNEAKVSTRNWVGFSEYPFYVQQMMDKII